MTMDDQVENALNPVRGVRDALRRRGIEPRDYARQNIKAVQHASQMNALRKHVLPFATNSALCRHCCYLL